MNLHVCTVCIHNDLSPIEKLKESCSFYGLKFGHYGFGERWKGSVECKIRMLIDYLGGIKKKYILFSDGFDSFMLANEKQILRKFKQLKTSVVASGSYTKHIASPRYKTVDKPFKYICAGQFMGERRALIKGLQIMYSKRGGEFSDNVMWDTAYKHKWFKFKVDHDCKLFQAMCTVGEDMVYFKGEKIYNKATRTYPCSIHFNGPKGGATCGVLLDKYYQTWLERRSH